MQPEIEKVAEAIRDELASGSFSKLFKPGETYDPKLQLEDADTLRVDVVPVRSEPERQDRGNIKWFNIVDIGVRFRFGTTHQNDSTGAILNRHIHGLFYLEQEIVTFLFQHQRLTNYDNAALSEDPVVRLGWSPKHMAEWRQFTGIIRVTYQTETEINPS
jgi:hypothetical protein